jgi:arylsulfatase
VHGVRGQALSERPAKGVETLAEVLRRNGYHTVAITEDGQMSQSYGFARGFDRFRELHSAESATDPVSRKTFAAAKQALASLRDETPFFLFVHTYQVHGPYLPPPGYVERITGELQTADTPAIDLYDGEILFLDELLDDFLDAARSDSLAESTYVVVFSDHGEEFRDHGRLHHGRTLFQEMLHVPLLVWGPDVVQQRTASEWGLIDVSPTVLELAGLPRWDQARGESFRALLGGAARQRSAPLFAETNKRGRRSMIEGARKIIHDGRLDRFDVFDLTADPREQQGVVASGATLDAARAAFSSFARSCSDARDALAQRGGDVDERDQPPPVDWDEEHIKKLRALGYLR